MPLPEDPEHPAAPEVARLLKEARKAAHLDVAQGRVLFTEVLRLARSEDYSAGQAEALFGLSSVDFQEGRLEDSADWLDQCEQLCREIGDEALLARCWRAYGLIELAHDNLNAAARRFEEALDLARQCGARKVEGRTLQSLGELALARGEREEGKAHLREALAIQEAEGNQDFVAELHLVFGQVALEENELDAAEREFADAAREFGEADEISGQIEAGRRLAQLKGQRGSHEAARLKYEELIQHAREADFSRALVSLTREMAAYAAAAGETATAWAGFAEARDLAAQHGIAMEEAFAALGLGSLALDHRKLEIARQNLSRAHDLADALQDRLLQANACFELGKTEEAAREFNQARRHLEAAIRWYGELEMPLNQAEVYQFLGLLDSRMDRLEQALTQHKKALELYRQFGSREDVGRSLIGVGDMNSRLSLGGNALTAYREAVEVFRELGDDRSLGLALSFIGGLEHGYKNLALAESYYEQALALFRKVGDAHNVGYTLLKLAERHYQDTEKSKALSLEALEVFRGIQASHGEAEALQELARVEGQARNFSGCREALDQALSLFQELGDSASECDTLWRLASLLFQSEEYEEGMEKGAEALEISVSMRHDEVTLRVLFQMADASLTFKQPLRAAWLSEIALQLARSHQLPESVTYALRYQYWALRDLGEADAALGAGLWAREGFRCFRPPPPEAREFEDLLVNQDPRDEAGFERLVAELLAQADVIRRESILRCYHKGAKSDPYVAKLISELAEQELIVDVVNPGRYLPRD